MRAKKEWRGREDKATGWRLLTFAVKPLPFSMFFLLKKQFLRFRSASLLLPALLGACASVKAPVTAPTASVASPTEILLLGCDHLAQTYKADNANTDVLTPKRQAELAALRAQLGRFKPEVVMIEELPERQARIDSLYQLYQQNKLDLATLPNGRSENYQLGFALAKELGLARVYCVNAPGGTSQSILHQGKNIELYQQETTQMRETTVKPAVQQLQSGSLTLGQYLRYLNSPATIQRLHHVVYRTPARVTDGTLKPDEMVDANFLNPKYVGAEFISVFYNRDLKIYSNIVTTQLATKPRRMLQVIGLRHVGSLQGIFRDDPEYRLVDALSYLPRK